MVTSFFQPGRLLRQQPVPERAPLISFAPYPSTVSCVPLEAELVSGGPFPLPLSEGGQASQGQAAAVLDVLPVKISYQCYPDGAYDLLSSVGPEVVGCLLRDPWPPSAVSEGGAHKRSAVGGMKREARKVSGGEQPTTMD